MSSSIQPDTKVNLRTLLPWGHKSYAQKPFGLAATLVLTTTLGAGSMPEAFANTASTAKPESSAPQATTTIKKYNFSKWHVDTLLSDKYRPLMIEAADKMIKMHPSAVFRGAILTESRDNQFDKFGSTLRSSANAFGAAQVLLATAIATAPSCTGKQLDENLFYNNKDYNVKIGQCYFMDQVETFGNPLMGLLAYNGGPGNSKGTAGLTGRIRNSGLTIENTGKSMIELISTIKNDENRRYAIYTMLHMNLIDPDKLDDDVKNGWGTPYTPRTYGSGEGKYASIKQTRLVRFNNRFSKALYVLREGKTVERAIAAVAELTERELTEELEPTSLETIEAPLSDGELKSTPTLKDMEPRSMQLR